MKVSDHNERSIERLKIASVRISRAGWAGLSLILDEYTLPRIEYAKRTQSRLGRDGLRNLAYEYERLATCLESAQGLDEVPSPCTCNQICGDGPGVCKGLPIAIDGGINRPITVYRREDRL